MKGQRHLALRKGFSITGLKEDKTKIDVRALAAPRVQTRPEGVPELHIPGVSPIKQPSGPLVGIFDNFDAMVAAEELAARERAQKLTAGAERSYFM